MNKVRINDLARELEVKSRPILDALEAIGVSGKTHSSSIDEDQAVRVRAYFSGDRSGTTPKPAAEPSPNSICPMSPSRATPCAPSWSASRLSPRLDRRRLRVRPSAPPARPIAAPATTPAAPAQAAAPAVASAPVPAQPAVVQASAVPAQSVARRPLPAASYLCPTRAPASSRRRSPPRLRSRVPWLAAPPSSSLRQTPSPLTKPSVNHTGRRRRSASCGGTADTAGGSRGPTPAAPVVETPPAPEAVDETAAASPAAPARRVIMPQTGPRPIYTAPAPVAGAAPAAVPSSRRPRPGFPPAVPAEPPARVRPWAPPPAHAARCTPRAPSPGDLPVLADRAQRVPASPPAHVPVSLPVPASRRVLAEQPGGAPEGGPPAGMRPARPGQRRGGQRYEKVKEGPMKGFQPPPRYGGLQNVPRAGADHQDHHRHRKASRSRISPKSLKSAARTSFAVLLMKGVLVTVNQSLEGELVKDVARQFGADATVISVEEQLEK